MSAIELKVDEKTGELLQNITFVRSSSVPSIKIDINDVAIYHNEPSTLIDLISSQAAYAVFDVSTKKGRDACKAHAANIIRCISPAINESKRLAAEAKKICNQDVSFRKEFEQGIRSLAAFHRKPLTEYEEEQERIIQAEKAIENAKIEQEKYLSDWADALIIDELFSLRKLNERASYGQKRTAQELRESANRIEEQSKYADSTQARYDDLDRVKNLRMQANELEEKQNRKLSSEKFMIIEVVAELFCISEYSAEKMIIELFGVEKCGI